MAVHVLSRHFSGERIFLPPYKSMLRFQGVYTNSAHFLVRFDVENELDCETITATNNPRRRSGERHALFAMVVSALEKLRDISFTLQIFCTAPFRFYVSPSRPEKLAKLKGRWQVPSSSSSSSLNHTDTNHVSTAGGPYSDPTYFRNPQISFSLSRPSDFHCELLVPKGHSCHIMVVKTSSSDSYMPRERLKGSSLQNEVMSSAIYRTGFTCVSSPPRLDTGSYVIIPSLYTANTAAPFILSIYTNVDISVVEL